MSKAILLMIMTIMSYLDIKTHRIQGLLLGLFGSVVLLWAGRQVYLGQRSLQGVMIGALLGVVLLIIAFCTKQIGYADGIIVCGLGIGLGGVESMIILWFALCGAAFVSLLLYFFFKKEKKYEIPFVPFLEGGFLIWMFFLA